MNNISDKIILSYIIKYRNDYILETTKGLFNDNNLDSIAEIMRRYFENKMELPKYQQLELMMLESGEFERADFDIIKMIYEDKTIDNYDIEYVDKKVKAKIIELKVENALVLVSETFTTMDFDDENAVSNISRIKNLIDDNIKFDFDDSLGKNVFDAENLVPEDEEVIKTGIPFFDDNLLGGYANGSLILYMGVSGIGKTWFLCNDAINFVNNGKNVVFITLEMGEGQILKRIVPNLLSIDFKNYDDEARNTNQMKQKIQSYLNTANALSAPPGFFYVKKFDDINAYNIMQYVDKIEKHEKQKVDVIVIDYLNLMSPNVRTRAAMESTYQMMRFTSLECKKMAMKTNSLVLSACQANRGQYRSLEAISLDNIADSVAIVYNTDYIHGIYQDEFMHSNNEWGLKILKIRNGVGKNAVAKVDCDTNYMRFTYEQNQEIFN